MFPEGIGPVECVNVEHEEVLLIPRWVDCRRVTFKYGLGDEFIEVLRTLHKTGLDRTEPVARARASRSRRATSSRRRCPIPADARRPHARRRTCAGTLVTGTGTDGAPRAVYLYHVADNAETMARDGAQAVVWQTAINPVVAMELLAAGTLVGRRRARPRGVRRGPVPRPAGRVRRAARRQRARSRRPGDDPVDGLRRRTTA